MRRNHTVEADLAGESIEFVAVGVVCTIDVNVVSSGGFRRHIVIGTFDSLCIGSCGHAEECHSSDEDFCNCSHSLLFIELLLILLEHHFVSGFEVDFHLTDFLGKVLADTVEQATTYI